MGKGIHILSWGKFLPENSQEVEEPLYLGGQEQIPFLHPSLTSGRHCASATIGEYPSLYPNSEDRKISSKMEMPAFCWFILNLRDSFIMKPREDCDPRKEFL